MKAIEMTEQGAPDVLRLVDLPDPVPGPGQVLVRVQAAAALERLLGWVSTGQVVPPAVQALPLSAAAEAHRLLEGGATTGKLVLRP